PALEDVVGAGGDETFAVGTDQAAEDLGALVGDDGVQHLALGDVGDLGLPLVAGDDEGRAVGGQGQVGHAAGRRGREHVPVAARCDFSSRVAELPEADAAVGGAG